MRRSVRAFPRGKLRASVYCVVYCCGVDMTQLIITLVALCVVASAAPPAPPRAYPQPAPAQLQNLQAISALDYFNDGPELAGYFHQQPQKQAANDQNGSPARLESLEPDSEVELIPGAQQPQQPPQQNPVSPNLPGLVPGQRVFIVHMPVPGYRPGTIGGYQPLYIVAAAPQGSNGYAANGYQNAILLNPAGQVVSPYFGYPGVGQYPGAAQGQPGFLAGAPGQAAAPGQAGLLVGAPLYRPFEQVYQDPAFAYQQAGGPQGQDGRPVHFSQLVNLQGQPANSARNVASEAASNTEAKRVGQARSEELKDFQEPQHNARPAPAHRSKA